MISDATRREFIKVFQLAAAAGILPSELLAAQAVPKQNSTNVENSSIASNFLQSMSSTIDSHLQDLDSASASLHQNLSQQLMNPTSNGATISPQSAPAMPYVPGSNEETDTDLEGATREDFPADYTKFDTQTGLFGEEGEAALPAGF